MGVHAHREDYVLDICHSKTGMHRLLETSQIEVIQKSRMTTHCMLNTEDFTQYVCFRIPVWKDVGVGVKQKSEFTKFYNKDQGHRVHRL